VELTSHAPSLGLALGLVPGASGVGDVLADASTVLALPGDDPLPPGHDPAMRRRRDRPAAERRLS
jgi:hypothetical protein